MSLAAPIAEQELQFVIMALPRTKLLGLVGLRQALMLCAWIASVASVCACSAVPDSPRPEPRYEFGCPDSKSLACTGLYGSLGEHWFSKQLGEGIHPYAPSAALWSDGMEKKRFVYIPPRQVIDASTPNDWVFPLGTRFWKEFAWQGKRIETRYLEKRADGWLRTTYRWDDDQSNATELTVGELNVLGTAGDSYEIPATTACDTCHANGSDFVLGFGQVLMASQGATGLTWRELNARHLVEPPLSLLTLPGTPVAQAALGYLHANCGVSCHNDHFEAVASWTGFHMKLEVEHLATVTETNTYLTGVGVMSYIFSTSTQQRLLLIKPNAPDDSAVFYRASQRGEGSYQMPPIATHRVDPAGLAAIRAWIQSLPAN